MGTDAPMIVELVICVLRIIRGDAMIDFLCGAVILTAVFWWVSLD